MSESANPDRATQGEVVRALRPLLDEHQTLLPGISELRTTAESVDHVDLPTLRARVGDDEQFLRTRVLMHARTEERVLYPEIQRVMNSSTATIGMTHDHEQIAKLIAEVVEIHAALDGRNPLTTDLVHRIRRVFYGLYALLLTHFQKEEELFLPQLVRHLDVAEARSLVTRMAHEPSDA